MRQWGIVLGVMALLVAFNVHAQEDKVQTWLAQADTLMQHEDFEDAIKLYDKILQTASKDSPIRKQAQYNRIVCLYSLDELKKALEEVNQFIEETPEFPQARLLRAFIYRDMDNTEGQLRDISALVRLNPLNVDLIKWQSYLLIQEEKYDSARTQLKFAAGLRNDAEIETYLGMTYYYSNDPDSAILHFDKAIDMKPDAFPALMYASAVCLDQSAYELALNYLDKASLLDPNNLSVMFYKGIALTEIGKRDEGCRYLSKAFYGGEDAAGDYLQYKCFRYDPD
ncbi:MAG TPA: tetratricopeptide repeat protein [Cyclobacteriaceae bacterium]|jgi:tetratricopeptide (TPR) repeat protein